MSAVLRTAHTSERKAKKTNPNAKVEFLEDLGYTTTGAAKEREAELVRQYRKNGHKLPLNKEKDKKYHIH